MFYSTYISLDTVVSEKGLQKAAQPPLNRSQPLRLSDIICKFPYLHSIQIYTHLTQYCYREYNNTICMLLRQLFVIASDVTSAKHEKWIIQRHKIMTYIMATQSDK